MNAPAPPRVYETILYAHDVAATAVFYRDVLGLEPIGEPEGLMAAFRMTSGAVLLIFDPRRSETPGRAVPSHGGHGPGHVAFGVDAGQLKRWRERLAEQGVAIERESRRAAQVGQLYFRDPAGNSVELVEGDIWT